MCAFISSDLALGAHVYIKGPAGHNLGEGDCMYMLKCIYGLVKHLASTACSVVKFTRRLV